ncbi:MAG: class I SAM-dependent methyltransferase [Betaproteobacteria bacterium]|nr:class I SAM-dependent methyltransferase [Betaproteobacteria bacterium]
MSSPPRNDRAAVLAGILRERVRTVGRRLLVVGCGSGTEAAALAAALGAEVVGIDLAGNFDPAAAAVAQLRTGDATCLEFADASFDLIHSYHVLEHIPNYNKALAEMRRVLAPGGWYCIGTPNRLRLVGYLGSQQTAWRDKLAWNAADWNARLHGRFRNELGAHAGFTSAELQGMLKKAFGNAEEISLRYYLRLYRNHAGLLSALGKSGLSRFAFPALYFVGTRRDSSPAAC